MLEFRDGFRSRSAQIGPEGRLLDVFGNITKKRVDVDGYVRDENGIPTAYVGGSDGVVQGCIFSNGMENPSTAYFQNTNKPTTSGEKGQELLVSGAIVGILNLFKSAITKK